MKDVLLDCLTIGSAFSACSEWGRLVSKGNLHLPLCNWTGMFRNYQLAWCQMLVALAFICNQVGNNDIETPLLHSKLLFHPHLPANNVSSTGASSKTPGNQSSSSGSKRCPSD
ncbi:hypothetical protein DSO57_1036324 [Entomophthora muscae]|uniref:Uncharacterized protein n=1 Tax=Entomophthora muscae TaxID=34485 RepID=A0ACC2RQ72_9FUNG|nr:hypothetical protein DSO57_1036324 [Entomophthora muscae]